MTYKRGIQYNLQYLPDFSGPTYTRVKTVCNRDKRIMRGSVSFDR